MKTTKLSMAIALILSSAMISGSAYAYKPGCTAPPCGGGGGEPEPTQGNNLSFPAIAVDGYPITPITATQFNVAYTGDYPGLTAAEIAGLVASGPWYPQKTAANAWQAGYQTQAAVDVTWVDWGDSIESVSPRVGFPARLEVTLYKALATPMTAYTMAVLENPSSSTELQGTNTTTYESGFATITSGLPKLVVQQLGSIDPATLTWDGTRWVAGTVVPRVIPVTFAPELNVGGKYIYGATQGGWRPDVAGRYRITFYVPAGSGVALKGETGVGNYSDGFSAGGGEDHEGGAVTPVVVPGLNLTYVDVVARSGSGGRLR